HIADAITALKDLRRFEPQVLSNILWAFATSNVSHHTGLFERATLRESHTRLFDKVAYEVIEHRDLSTFNPQALSNIVWAYATAKRLDPTLFDSLAGAIAGRKHDLSCQEVSNILWAYATVGLVESPVFNAVVPRVKTLLCRCNRQNLANIAWSYAVANVDDPTLFGGHFTNVLLEKINSFRAAELRQFYQWHIWQKEEKGNTGLPPAFEGLCYEAFTSAEPPTVSSLQGEAFSVLQSMGLHPKEEELTQKGYSLDVLVEVNGRKVGVEVDGPWHFIGNKPTGKTILKRRQIANVEGIMLVSVPYWEWEELGLGWSKKQDYLRSLLGVR
ncbi:hypothetical protein ACHAXR_008788, partial [Thalassiosira sp. AJA248-18]